MPLVSGIDFTSRPSRRKPQWASAWRVSSSRVDLVELVPLPTWDDYAAWLARPFDLIGIDHPFGLPREMQGEWGVPVTWEGMRDWVTSFEPAAWREFVSAWRAGQPPGRKFRYRATDREAGSQSPLNTVNPPVGMMLRAGLPYLDRTRMVEVYPSLTARAAGAGPYKGLDPSPRQRLLASLKDLRGRLLVIPADLAEVATQDTEGDALDAVIAGLTVAWAVEEPLFGLPERYDDWEGAIVDYLLSAKRSTSSAELTK